MLSIDRRGLTSPSRLIIVLTLLIAGCATLPEDGAFAEAGFTDNEVSPGEEVWARLRPDDLLFMRHVRGNDLSTKPVILESVDGERVRLRHGVEVRREDIVVSARVKAGTFAWRPDDSWTECPSVVPIKGFVGRGHFGDQVTIECAGVVREITASEVNLLEHSWLSHQRQREWVVFALAVLGFGLPRLRAKAHRRAEHDADQALQAMNEAFTQATEVVGPVGQQALEVLRCIACDAAVPLESRGTSTCRHCGVEAILSPAYVALMFARNTLGEVLARQATALEAYRHARSPWRSLPMLVLGGALLWGSFNVETTVFILEILQFLSGAGGLGLLIAAFGQLTGTSALDTAVLGLAARPVDGGGHDCRACGAPLPGATNGSPVLCGYCGAQNLIPAEALRAARRDASQAQAADYSIAVLIADARLAHLEAMHSPALALSWIALTISFIGTIVLVTFRWG